MKTKLLLLVSIFFVAFTSCSEDDSVPNNTLAGKNGFEFEQAAYVTNRVFIDEDNNIFLSDQNLETEENVEGHFAIFTIKDGALRESTYTVGNKLERCSALIDGVKANDAVQGEDLLGDENTEDGFMRIKHFNNFDQEIDIIFEFIRKDGKLVSGSFSGNFQRL